MDTAVQSMPVPTAEDLRDACKRFGYTIASVAIQRDPEQGWIGPAVMELAAHIATNLTEDDWAAVEAEFQGLGQPALSGLFLEMTHVNVRFQTTVEKVFGDNADLPVIGDEARAFVGEQNAADPSDAKDVAELDIVYGSFERQFRRLPKWLQQVVEVLMELLKLTRGVVG